MSGEQIAPDRPTTRDPAPAWPGSHQPLGATWSAESTNFAVFAPEATAVDALPVRRRRRRRATSRPCYALTEQTLGIWHGALPGIAARPALRLPRRRPLGAAAGPAVQPRQAAARPLRPRGQRRRSTPTARSTATSVPARATPRAPHGRSAARDATATPRPTSRRPWSSTTTSTGATTTRCGRGTGGPTRSSTSCTSRASPSCTPRCPSSCAAPTPASTTDAAVHYLKDLGITTVELLPVHQFVPEPHLAALGLTNYWGYNSIGFFAPHNGYSSARRPRRAGRRVQGDGQGAARAPASR